MQDVLVMVVFSAGESAPRVSTRVARSIAREPFHLAHQRAVVAGFGGGAPSRDDPQGLIGAEAPGGVLANVLSHDRCGRCQNL